VPGKELKASLTDVKDWELPTLITVCEIKFEERKNKTKNKTAEMMKLFREALKK
jgi:hypothetical protein